jgi:hypothetical protein
LPDATSGGHGALGVRVSVRGVSTRAGWGRASGAVAASRTGGAAATPGDADSKPAATEIVRPTPCGNAGITIAARLTGARPANVDPSAFAGGIAAALEDGADDDAA